MSVLLLVVALGATDIDVTVSDAAGNRLTPLQPIAWQPSLVCNPPASAAGNHAEATIAIPFPLQDRQTIGGFGASFTESSAINLNALPTSKQQELLELLFGESGARLSAMKTTMLANDFAAAAPWSTYDDSAGDTALTNFSIARDLQPNGSLTLVKRAIAAGFDGTLQAYMDYPPDWMLQGRLPQNATVAPELYDTLARYQAMYIEAYAKHGVVIDFFECFNEPTDSYTQMSPRQLIRYLGEHIGPLLDKRGIRPRTKLTYGGQADRLSAADFVTQVMTDPVARQYMDVIAYHGYDCQYEDDGSCNDARQNYDKIAALAAAYPGVPLWLTEICYAYNGDDPNCTKPETLKYCSDYPRNPWAARPTCRGVILRTARRGAIASCASCRRARPAGSIGTCSSTNAAGHLLCRPPPTPTRTSSIPSSSSTRWQAHMTRPASFSSSPISLASSARAPFASECVGTPYRTHCLLSRSEVMGSKKWRKATQRAMR